MDFSEFEAMFQVKRLEKDNKRRKREESEWYMLHVLVSCGISLSLYLYRLLLYRSTEVVRAVASD